jgi:hypothetical protein
MKLFLVLILTLFFSCATTNKNATADGPLSSVVLSQRDLDAFFNDFRNENNPLFSGKAINIISNYLRADIYNSRIIKKVQSHKEYENFQELFAQFVQTDLAKQMDQLRIRTINQDELADYINNYKNEPDAHQRFLLTEEIVNISFPDMQQVDLFAKLSVKMLTGSEDLQKRAAYKAIFDLLKGRQMQLNLYLFKNIPLETLQEVIDYSNLEHVKGSSQFISNIQKEIHDALIQELNELFINAGLPKTDLSVFDD